MVAQTLEFDVVPLLGTANFAVSIRGEQIGIIAYEAVCTWTAVSDDQSRTCETLQQAMDFIRTVWEPGLPPTIGDLGRMPMKAA
jgi:hypothetical protein